MSLPNVLEFRKRVETIPNLDKKIAFKTLHLICGRVGEVITRKCPSDITANPTGAKLSVTKETYQPDLNNPQERDTWTFKKMLQGQQVNYSEIAQLKEEVVIFKVSTEKRMGLTREIGLPFDPKYDPWVQQVYTYLSNKKDHGFNFSRQQMWVTACTIFKGLTYTIHPYKRADLHEITKAYQYDEKGKLLKIQVPEGIKNFTDHGIRHLRNVELKKFYGLSPEERAGYGGWTLATVAGTSAAQDRYEEASWRLYFPKMLKQR